ncbi:MAG: pseudouridine synthase [Eubacterium sp.]
MRLDKYLTNLAIGSRSQVKVLIKRGHIKVNGQKVLKPEYHINEEADKIEMDDASLEYSRFYYYMLNKPAGVVSAVTDKHCRTVLDIMDVVPRNGLFPVGRLDKDTEGLLLITNDGQLAHDLLSPSKHVDKTYYVELNGSLTYNDIGLFKEGLDIGEKSKTKPAILEIVDLDRKDKAYITITEGKYHQVKRMFAAIGLKVTYLKRISMGTLKLDESLCAGEYRKLTESEIEQLTAGKGIRY